MQLKSVGSLIVLLWLGLPSNAIACTCVAGPGEVAWPTLEQAAAISDVVLIGRITKQVTLSEPPPYEGQTVAYVEVEVIKGIRGVVSRTNVRVWDGGFGSSCSVDLRPLRTGVVVAFALERNSGKYREYQEVMKLKIGADDYLLWACGDYKSHLANEEDVRAVGTRLSEAVRRGRRTRR